MRSRRAGASGPLVSIVGLDCAGFGGPGCDTAVAQRVVDAAIDAGITLFDTSDVAGDRGGAETVLGEALRKRRDSVVVCTKFGGDMGVAEGPRGARRYINFAVEASLRRLGSDHIDLYQQQGPDDSMPVEETFSALHRLAVQGKIRYFGGAEYELWRVHEATAIAQTVRMTPLTSIQYRYNLLHRGAEPDVFPACGRGGVGILATDPTAAGLLRSATAPDDAPARETAARLEAITGFARARGLAPLNVAIGHAAAQDHVAAVLVKVTSADEVDDLVSAADWRPTAADLEALDAVAPPGTSAPYEPARETEAAFAHRRYPRTEENHGPAD